MKILSNKQYNSLLENKSIALANRAKLDKIHNLVMEYRHDNANIFTTMRKIINIIKDWE